MKFNPTTGKLETSPPPGGGSGDVVGPASATDKAIARYDLTTGKIIQDSGIIIEDGASGSLSNTNTGDQLMFGTIAVAAQPDVDPVGTGDTLTLVAGTNVTITTNNTTKEITFNATAVKDWWHYIGSTKFQNTTTTLAGGDVLTYNYTPTASTVYRYITTALTGLYPTTDAFYATFDGVTLSDLITTR